MNLQLKVNCRKDKIVSKSIEIMNRHLRQRQCCEAVEVEHFTPSGKQIELNVNSFSIPEEGFRIVRDNEDSIVITGGSASGVLYGIGKMLRQASYNSGEFAFGSWQGDSYPAKNVRMLYLAAHFHNYYHIAPINEIKEYIEDNALRGFNSLVMCLDKHHFKSGDDLEMLKFVQKIREIFSVAESAGMKPAMTVQANEGYQSTPDHLRATDTGRSFYGNEICPSTAEGMQLILKNHEDTFKLFHDIDLGYLSLWSYDQGGCACDKCRHWGANGMLRCGKEVAKLYRSYYPDGKIIYSTWLFDHRTGKDDEWRAFADALKKNEEPWMDIILADGHNEFPEFPLKNGVPGNRPMINFPEISMWGMFPWGALGATPLVKRFSKIWSSVCEVCDGGMLYSEGIYEDINKALYAGFYWNGNFETSEILTEYFNFEFGVANSAEQEKLKTALDILEKNHRTKFQPVSKFSDEFIKAEIKNGHKVLSSRKVFGFKKYEYPNPEDASDILSETDITMPEWGRNAWRWRILLLRSIIDTELKHNDLEISKKCDECFEELAEIFHSAGISEYKVSPLTEESVESIRSTEDNV